MSSLTMFTLSQDSSWNQVSLYTVIILLFPRPPKLLLSSPKLPPPAPTTILSGIPFLPSHHHYHDHPDCSSSHTFTRGGFPRCFQRRRILCALLWKYASCNGLLSFLSAKTFNEYNMSPLNSYLQRVRHNGLLPTAWLRS